MKKCGKDCKHFKCVANTDETGAGICGYPDSYFPVTVDNKCYYELEPYTCKNCNNFGEYECLGMQETDKPCGFFIDKNEDLLYNILYEWKLRGIDVGDKVSQILKDIEENYKPL